MRKFFDAIAAVGITICIMDSASAAGLESYYASGIHAICGLQAGEIHVAAPAGAGVKHLIYKRPLICRHAIFGLDPSKPLPPEAQLPAAMLEKFMSRKRIPIPSGDGLDACRGQELQQTSQECASAISHLGRTDLMNTPRFRALEVLDNYFGRTDFNDPDARRSMQMADVFLRAHPESTAVDLVKALDIESELTKAPPPPRLEDYMSVSPGADKVIDLTITSGQTWAAVRLEATAKMATYGQQNFAFLQFKNLRVVKGTPPSPANWTTATLDSIWIQWCNPNGSAPQLDGVEGEPVNLIGGLEETVSATSEFQVGGLIARLPLPPSDVHLERTWLCVHSWTTINNSRGWNTSVSNDSLGKGCKSSCR